MRWYTSLQAKAVAGVGVFVVLIVLITSWAVKAVQKTAEDYQILNHVSQLEVASDAIRQKAENYVENAPRDYPTYYRDVAVYHKNLERDLDHFEQTVDDLRRANAERGGAPLLVLAGLVSDTDQLTRAVERIAGRWETFRRGFSEEMGSDPEEPRLEWGAEYIVEDPPGLMPAVKQGVADYRRVIGAELAAVRATGRAAVWATVVLGLAALGWFYWAVVRPIRYTAHGCQRVASGEFGYQLAVRGRDELADLVGSFNSLSARARLVLSLLDHLHRGETVSERLQAIHQEAKDYLGHDWLGLLELDDSGRTLRALGAAPNEREGVGNLELGLERSDAGDLMANGKVRAVDDLRRDSVARPQARLSRELSRRGGFASAVLLPVTANTGWRGLLVFAWTTRRLPENEQLELLDKLSELLANGLSRAERDAPPSMPPAAASG